MTTTVSLNSNDTIMVTTYFGGSAQGRCYTIRLRLGDKELVTTLNEDEFFEMVLNYNDDFEINAAPVLSPGLDEALGTEDRFVAGSRIGRQHVGRYARIRDMTGVIVRSEAPGQFCLDLSSGGWVVIRDNDLVELL